MEILGEGPVEPLTGRLWRWLRAHPVTLAALVVGALAVASGAALIAVRPPSPVAVDLTVNPSGATSAGRLAPAWEESPGGRPLGPPTLAWSLLATGRSPGGSGASGETTSVVGLTGPGIAAIRNPAVRVGAPRTPVTLRATLDCARLPATTPLDAADAYRIRLRASAPGRRTGEKAVPAGPLAEHWSRQIRTACAAWSVHRYLTVSRLTATADPLRPRLAVEMTVENSGSRPVVVTAEPGEGSASPSGELPMRVPAGGRATARLLTSLSGCAGIDPARIGTGEYDDPTRSTSSIGLTGREAATPSGPVATGPLGAGDPLAERRIEEASDGVAGPGGQVSLVPAADGVPLGPRASRTLGAAMVDACGGMRPVLAIVDPGAVRFTDTERLTAAVRLYLTPGKVRSLRVTRSPAAEGEGAELAPLVPMWRERAGLRPDRSGLVEVDLPYRYRPGGLTCRAVIDRGVPLRVEVEVPVRAGTRRLTYDTFLQLPQDRAAQRFCAAPVS